MKKVFLYAYDRVNLGDDLFIRTITGRYPDCGFYMWSGRENQKNFSDCKNLRVIDQESIFIRFLRRIRPSLVSRYKAYLEKKCSAVVYIGGSIFIEYENWQDFANWWEYEAENRPFYILGANFGPYRSQAYKQKYEEIFRKTRDICFRDTYSQSLFADVPTARYAPDILFSSMTPYRAAEKKDQVFVSLINCSYKARDDRALKGKDETALAEMERLCRSFINDGYRVILSSFCRIEGDEETAEILSRRLASSRVSVLNYEGTNSRDLLNAIGESQYVIALRFHALVLGLAAGCHVIPIIYSDKTKNILQDLGYQGQYADIRRMQAGDIDYPAIRLDPARQQITDLESVIARSSQHFAMLDRVLKEE